MYTYSTKKQKVVPQKKKNQKRKRKKETKIKHCSSHCVIIDQ